MLFVGGTSTGYSFLSSAEVFDPVTMRFSRTGAMSVARESHVGALLPNGLVLIAGGHSGRRESIRLYDSAELYGPERGVFRPTGSMTQPRHKQAAAILPDGRVLVTGGSDERDDRGQYRDAEIYDPQSERFSSAGQLTRARYKHQGTMTPLVDGRILIAGGAGELELFDAALGRFTLVSSPNALAGNFSTSTRLENGHVLIVGGYGNGTGGAKRSLAIHSVTERVAPARCSLRPKGFDRIHAHRPDCRGERCRQRDQRKHGRRPTERDRIAFTDVDQQRSQPTAGAEARDESDT